MKLGVCIGIDQIEQARKLGCDYIELPFSQIASLDDDGFEAVAQAMQKNGLTSPVMNVLLRPDMRLTGEHARSGEALDFLQGGLPRAKRLGAKTLVFGSGAARRMPQGAPREGSLEQLAQFAAAAAAMAHPAGVAIAIEPLNGRECNLINTVAQAMDLCRAAGNPPGLGVLADLYHMSEMGDPISTLKATDGKLLHCHIAQPGDRRFCLPGDYHSYYGEFFTTLSRIGYAGGVSLEGVYDDLTQDFARSSAYLGGFIHRVHKTL